MRRRKVVKFKKYYLVKIEGKIDTVFPDEYPFQLKSVESILKGVVEALDSQFKHRNVTMVEADLGDE